MSEKRVVLVTGAATGLGAELIRSFAAKEFLVVINYLLDDEADILYREMRDNYGKDRVMMYQANVTDRTEVKQMYDEIINKFGRVDLSLIHILK